MECPLWNGKAFRVFLMQWPQLFQITKGKKLSKRIVVLKVNEVVR